MTSKQDTTEEGFKTIKVSPFVHQQLLITKAVRKQKTASDTIESLWNDVAYNPTLYEGLVEYSRRRIGPPGAAWDAIVELWKDRIDDPAVLHQVEIIKAAHGYTSMDQVLRHLLGMEEKKPEKNTD